MITTRSCGVTSCVHDMCQTAFGTLHEGKARRFKELAEHLYKLHRFASLIIRIRIGFCSRLDDVLRDISPLLSILCLPRTDHASTCLLSRYIQLSARRRQSQAETKPA